jgi:anti-sigma B factor antagonist
MAFELIKDRHGGVLVLTPKGRLDNENAAEFELAAQELLVAGERHLVIDLPDLNYASNAGLRVFGKLGKALKGPTTSLRLSGLTPALRQVFEAAGVLGIFDIRPTLQAALSDHPAAQGAGELGQLAARLLGVEAANDPAPATDAIRTIATLAGELMSTGVMAPRAARPMVDATQLAPKVRAEDIARARQQQQQAAAAPAKPVSFWQRLFGGGKSK